LWKQHFTFGPADVRAAVDESGAVFVGDDDGIVARLDARTGDELWRFDAGARVRSAPVLWRDLVIFGDGGGAVTALKKNDGKLVWSNETGGEILGRASASGEVVHVNSTDGYLYALYGWDGNIIWRYNLQQPAGTRPAMGGGMVVCAGDRGRAAGLAPGERRVAWEYISGSSPLTSPLIVNGSIVFAADRGAIYGLNLTQGTYMWKYMAGAPIAHELAAHGDVIYFTTTKGEVAAFDTSAQKELWRVAPAQGANRKPGGTPAVVQNWLLAPFDQAELFALDLDTGQTMWTFREQVLAPGAFAGLSTGGDWIAAPNDNGYLYLFRIQGGAAPAALAAVQPGEKTNLPDTSETNGNSQKQSGQVPESISPEIRELLDEAKQAFLAGDYEQAALAYKKIIEKEPDNKKAHYNMAVALEHVGGERYATPIVLPEAAEHYERALEIDPEFLPARINLGILYSKLQQNNRAADILKQALAVRDDKNVRYNLAVILEKLKRFAEAREQWEAYLALEDDETLKNKIRSHLKNLEGDAPPGEN